MRLLQSDSGAIPRCMGLSEDDKKRLGGSDAAALVGLGKRSPIEVFERIVHGVEVPDNPAMRRGRMLEDYARQMYRDETGAKLFGPRSCPFPGKPHLRANLDDVAEREGALRVVELKTSTWRLAHQWDGEEVPVQYLLQTQWYMRAANLPVADLAVLFSIDDFRVRPLNADPELQDMLLDAAERFWRNHVLTGRPPPPDSTEAYEEYLARRFPRPSKPPLVASPEVERLMETFRKETALGEEAFERAQLAKNTVKLLMGEAEGLHGAFGKVSWRSNKDTVKTDWEALAQEIGPPQELIQKHTHPKAGPRVFRISWAKETE